MMEPIKDASYYAYLLESVKEDIYAVQRVKTRSSGNVDLREAKAEMVKSLEEVIQFLS